MSETSQSNERVDGRDPATLRPVSIEPGFTQQALGSVLIATGRTRVICTASLESRPPSWLERGGWITAEYAMLPGATRPRGGRNPGGRGKEIQRLIGRSLRASVELERLVGPAGGLSIVCDCDVIEADGGTRTASITGAWVALQIALRKLVAAGQLIEDPMIGPVAAVSVGLVERESRLALLDLCYVEDSAALVDLNVVMRGAGPSGGAGEPGLIEVQGTGERASFSRGELERMLDLAAGGIEQLLTLQQAALSRAGV